LKVLGSLKTIGGYSGIKEAQRAFKVYENLSCKIVPDAADQTVTILTKQIGLNYVEFWLRVDEDQQFKTVDGRMVRGSALDANGNEVATNRRMVFVKDSVPEKAVRALKRGNTMHVLGIPRVDLAIVSWRVHNADSRPEALGWNLPYEIIVVGKYNN